MCCGSADFWEEKQGGVAQGTPIVCLPLLCWFGDWLRPSSGDTSLIPYGGQLVMQTALGPRKHVSEHSIRLLS